MNDYDDPPYTMTDLLICLIGAIFLGLLFSGALT
jgi:hypothetical protein